jgi:hypothetical protein
VVGTAGTAASVVESLAASGQADDRGVRAS